MISKRILQKIIFRIEKIEVKHEIEDELKQWRRKENCECECEWGIRSRSGRKTKKTRSSPELKSTVPESGRTFSKIPNSPLFSLLVPTSTSR